MLKIILPAVAFSMFAFAAEAQTPTGPFIGTDSDGFETQTPFSLDPCIIERVFSNKADLCTPAGAGAHINTSLTFVCTVLPNSGSFLYGSERGASEIIFDTPVSRFGAYFASNSGQPDARAEFYDCVGSFIGTAPIISPASCTWTWNGWDAPLGLGFGRILIIGNHAPSGGGFLQLDDMEADFVVTCAEPGAKQCFGDGVDNTCPCGNDNNSSGPRGNEAGCANSFTLGGCNLTGTGSNSIGAGDLTLCFDGAIPGQPGLFFCGTSRINPLFGDGIRCCGGNVKRIQVIVPDATGSGCSTDDIGLDSGVAPGDTSCCQYWYRDPNGPCGSGFNLSNAYKVVWVP